MNEYDQIVAALPQFSGIALITAADPEGYPVSVECRPVASADGRSLIVEAPSWFDGIAGAASLCAHSHDEHFWNLRAFLAKGELKHGRSLQFLPTSFEWLVTGEITIDFLRRRREVASRYLTTHGQAWPVVPWNLIEEAKAALP